MKRSHVWEEGFSLIVVFLETKHPNANFLVFFFFFLSDKCIILAKVSCHIQHVNWPVHSEFLLFYSALNLFLFWKNVFLFTKPSH